MISGSAARARARPTRCCMPPGELARDNATPTRQGRPSRATSAAVLFRSAFEMPRTSSPKAAFSRTVRCGSRATLWNTMPIWRARTLAQLGGVQCRKILSFDKDLAEGRCDQPVEEPDECRLAAAGQAHDAEDLSSPDLDAGVGDTDHAAEVLQDLGLLRPRSLIACIAVGALSPKIFQADWQSTSTFSGFDGCCSHLAPLGNRYLTGCSPCLMFGVAPPDPDCRRPSEFHR